MRSGLRDGYGLNSRLRSGNLGNQRASWLALAGLIGALIPFGVLADMPWPSSSGQSDPYAYEQYMRAPVDCTASTTNAPNDLNCGDFKMTSRKDPSVPNTAQELGQVMGPAVDKAWDVTTGRPDIRIAVLDSGIKWNDQGAMNDLRDKLFLNWA